MAQGKHAYLIMAHNEWGILEKQLKLLDHEKNDLYLHIDKKADLTDLEPLKKCVRRSGLFFVPRLDVRWGDYSQIRCELELLKAAVPGNYDYYHLISGVDLPLKTQEELHRFFDMHSGSQFIHFAPDETAEKYAFRVLQYHFPRNVTSKNKLLWLWAKGINFLLRRLQNLLRFRRPMAEKIACGSNWFSITGDLAEYVVSREDWVEKHFRFSFCADELFLQTIVRNSPFYEKVFDPVPKTFEESCGGCLRLIDWNRGRPWVYRREDFDLLTGSDLFFARKFSTRTPEQAQIVEDLYHFLKK